MEYKSLEQDGSTLDVLEDFGGGLRIAVNRLGAELTSLARRDSTGTWQGFLIRDGETSKPASGWANHATVMGYFLHRLWQERSTYRGTEIRGGNHGFLRHFAFDAPEVGPDSLTYTVTADRVPKEAYPLAVSLRLTYRLGPDGLRVIFEFHNEEDVDAHVSFGLHPGFAISSLSSTKMLFPAGTYERHWAPGNFLDGRVDVIPFAGGEMPFSKEKLPDSYLIGLDQVPGRQFTVDDPISGHRVNFDFSEVPYLTLWSDTDQFVCVEPCWGLPDSNPPVPFEKKIGIQIIPPKGLLKRSFGIQPELTSVTSI